MLRVALGLGVVARESWVSSRCLTAAAGKLRFGRPRGVKLVAIGDSLGKSFEPSPAPTTLDGPTKGSEEAKAEEVPALSLELDLE